MRIRPSALRVPLNAFVLQPCDSRTVHSSVSPASPAQCIRLAALPVPLSALFLQLCEYRSIHSPFFQACESCSMHYSCSPACKFANPAECMVLHSSCQATPARCIRSLHLHCIAFALHCMTLHYIYCMTLHYIAWHCITLHYIA